MSRNEESPNYQYKIYEIYRAIYQNEEFFKKSTKNQEYQGYLIEKNLIDKIIKDGQYEKLKPLLNGDSYGILKNNIKDNNDKIKEIKKLIPKKFNKSDELLEELNKKKSFYIIFKNYIKKIIDETNQSSNCETKFRFNMDDNVSIIFNESDKLIFINDKSCIIDKNLLQEERSFQTTVSNNKKNFGNNSSFEQIKFKDDLEILIRIFFYNEYLREKENNSFKKLNSAENCETVYLINDLWMKEYKSYFNYQYIEDYLISEKEYLNAFIKDNYYLSNELIKNIMTNLSKNYINKINKKDSFDKSKTFKYEKNESNKKIDYTYNNHIINNKIYVSLTYLGYKLNDSVKKVDLYFIGNKKILLLNRAEFKKEIDEIGFINEKGVFIPEYLIENVEKDSPISLNILNNFFMKDFFNFFLEEKRECSEIKNEKNITIGRCYKLNKEKKSIPNSKTNIIVEGNNDINDNNKDNNFKNEKLIIYIF